ncbi:GGDEF domain-containing protein [Rhodoferax sp. 4810]|uniref:diguanylate cyclase n=2 Tax=Thiospirillum jenense TaxID=1653858 RepID=A0A839H5Y5_9GAMM|nr:GGDEF domain-containing protein [Rhodoferax jenense]MBB1124904.1 GGDEF domain-containing protein [Thiospirillum jenense]
MCALTEQEYNRIILFQKVPQGHMQDVLASCVIRILDAGELLLSPEQENDCLHILVSGTLGIHFKTLDTPEIRVIIAGESVGELSLIEQRWPSAYVIAKDPCRVLSMNNETFWQLVDVSGQVARNLLGQLAKWLLNNTENLVENRKTIAALHQQSMHDGLTGVYNRRWFDHALNEHLSRSVRSDKPITLILLDVDHFKHYNDTQGHQGGDQALIALANVLQERVRPADSVARYGGEEFAIILPNTTIKESAVIAERLRMAVALQPIYTPDGKQLPSITISQGLAQSSSVITTPQSLIELADAQLYRAKQAGRHCFCYD